MATTEMLKNLMTAALLALPEPWPYVTTCLFFLLHETKKGRQWPALGQYWKAYLLRQDLL